MKSKITPLILSVFAGLLLTACSSVPGLKPAPPQTLEQQQLEEQRREAEMQQRREERLSQEAHDLRKKYDRYTTTELKLMYQRYLEVAQGAGGREINYRINSLFPSNVDAKNMNRVLEVERELLRRWKSGDQEAKLPQFEQASTSSPSAN